MTILTLSLLISSAVSANDSKQSWTSTEVEALVADLEKACELTIDEMIAEQVLPLRKELADVQKELNDQKAVMAFWIPATGVLAFAAGIGLVFALSALQ